MSEKDEIDVSLQPDIRFPMYDNEKLEKDLDADQEQLKSPINENFKKQIKRENRLKKLYSKYNKFKMILGITEKPVNEPSVFTGIAFAFLKFLDFVLNTVLIVFLVISVYLGVLGIKNGVDPLKIVAICVFILSLSWVLEKIK